MDGAMRNVINEKNQIINEEGLPFFDPVEALPPGDPKAPANRPHGLVLPFSRTDDDRKRSKEERAKWMDSIFDQLEEEEERELQKEEEETDEEHAGRLRRVRAEEGGQDEPDDEDEDTSGAPPRSHAPSRGNGKAAVAAAGNTAVGSRASQSSFQGMRKGFLNSRPAAPAITTPSATPAATAGIDLGLQVKERTPASRPNGASASTNATRSSPPSSSSSNNDNGSGRQQRAKSAAASSPSSAKAGPSKAAPVQPVKQPQKRVGFKSDLVQEKTIPARGEETAPSVGSRLRFEDLSLADEDDEDHDAEEEEDQDEHDGEDEYDDDDDDEGEGFNIEDWDSDEGYDSDDLADLAPDLDADIDNAELAREYARARAGLIQSQALDAARRAAQQREDEVGLQGGEDIVPLDATVSDPSVRTSTTHRVSRFRASRLSRAVNDFDTLLHASKAANASSAAENPSSSSSSSKAQDGPALNPLLVVPELAPILYPKHGDILLGDDEGNTAELGGASPTPMLMPHVADNVELEGESDEDGERLHEVMRARLAAMEEQESLKGVSKTVVERSAGGGAAGLDAAGASTPSSTRTETTTSRKATPIAPGQTPTAPVKRPAVPVQPGAREAASTAVQQNGATTGSEAVPMTASKSKQRPAPASEASPPPAAKGVRFAADVKEEAPPAAAADAPAEPAPKVSRFKARKLAERGG